MLDAAIFSLSWWVYILHKSIHLYWLKPQNSKLSKLTKLKWRGKIKKTMENEWMNLIIELFPIYQQYKKTEHSSQAVPDLSLSWECVLWYKIFMSDKTKKKKNSDSK